ncbi:MAG TPA: PDZ domain-containing protein [Longimicrobiales bacterium]|nr:PDZ domain-containing protein [Longimicrobiales bacterium]
MNRVRGRMGGALLGAVMLAAGAAFTPADAQQDDDCRCVDRDGNEIENCTCFVMPDLDEVAAAWSRVRPRLGISVSTSQDSALDAQGAEVRSVLEDGPADEAGIREGDIITSLDGRSLLEPLDAETEEDFDEDRSLAAQRLLALAADLEPGQQVEIEYLRDGERRTATLEAEDLTRRALELYRDIDMEPMRERWRELREQLDTGIASWWRMGFPFASGARYGLELVELVPGLAEYFGVQEGVLVTDVDEDSTLGLQPGDVILRIGDRDVDTPERFLRLLATYEDGEVVNLRVRREGTDISVQGRIDG